MKILDKREQGSRKKKQKTTIGGFRIIIKKKNPTLPAECPHCVALQMLQTRNVGSHCFELHKNSELRLQQK